MFRTFLVTDTAGAPTAPADGTVSRVATAGVSHVVGSDLLLVTEPAAPTREEDS